MKERRLYVVDADIVDRGEAARACRGALEVLRPHLRLVVVDAYSDHEGEMPGEVVAAEAWLRERGRSLGRRPWWRRTWPADPGMAVEVDPADDVHWEVLVAYAPWSINVDLRGGGAHWDLGGFHDCGYSVVVALTDDEVPVLTACLEGVGPLVPLGELHVHRKGRWWGGLRGE